MLRPGTKYTPLTKDFEPMGEIEFSKRLFQTPPFKHTESVVQIGKRLYLSAVLFEPIDDIVTFKEFMAGKKMPNYVIIVLHLKKMTGDKAFSDKREHFCTLITGDYEFTDGNCYILEVDRLGAVQNVIFNTTEQKLINPPTWYPNA